MISKSNFKNETIRLATEVGVHVREIHIREMKNKWASCSSSGRLTFNSELLKQPSEVWINAILHELLHLRYPNHSKMFNLTLKSMLNKELKI
jgi:predicted metal-dependent hydrolase